ncbi:hypothetical protein [Citrobacter freundii]|uniref:hypothetical protein n=1 Tax=Citrobacter freundii TaxID=546 RepID=UPI0023B0DFB5|nr:hypothetical protein [Citrobacter freundii]
MNYSKHLKSLLAAYAFVVVPFTLMIIVKASEKKWHEIILSSDWSIASFIIFGQSLTFLSSVLISTTKNKKREGWEWYIAKVFLTGVGPSLVLYTLLLIKPSIPIGIGQIILFIYASYRFFVDGLAAKKLESDLIQ